MAKDILERYVTVVLDDSGGTARDISGDVIPGSLSIGFTNPEINMTGISNTISTYLADRADSSTTFQVHMNDTATTGAWTVIKGIINSNTERTLTISFGTNGAPAAGDPKFTGEHIVTASSVSPDGGKIVANVTLRPGPTADAAWGTV